MSALVEGLCASVPPALHAAARESIAEDRPTSLNSVSLGEVSDRRPRCDPDNKKGHGFQPHGLTMPKQNGHGTLDAHGRAFRETKRPWVASAPTAR